MVQHAIQADESYPSTFHIADRGYFGAEHRQEFNLFLDATYVQTYVTDRKGCHRMSSSRNLNDGRGSRVRHLRIGRRFDPPELVGSRPGYPVSLEARGTQQARILIAGALPLVEPWLRLKFLAAAALSITLQSDCASAC